MIQILIIIILLLFILSYKHYFIESFNAYNSKFIKNDEFTNLTNETKILSDIFNKISTDNNINTQDYILYNANLPFGLMKPLKEIITEFLNKDTYFQKIKYRLENFSNIYYKDTLDTRTFIFNTHIINNTNFSSRKIKIKLTIDNISQFINPFNDFYYDNLQTLLVNKYTTILSISLDDYISLTQSVSGLDNIKENIYTFINNKLHLSYPF